MNSGNNNATISMPGPAWGPGWAMLWPASFDSFQLDIVGFLAILGEGSVAANAQVSALSRLFYLPRLIPAPQALLYPTRPVTLEPTTKASVTAVASGMVNDHIHHVASILLSRGDEMPKWTVRCVRISKGLRQPTLTTWTDVFLRGQPTKAKARAHTQSIGPAALSVRGQALGPLAWVTLLGFSTSITLFIASIVFGDGMSMIATILLSLLSTLVGISNKWSLRLTKRRAGLAPLGDVVIRYPKGSFLIVKCDEDVARELFFAPEEIDYNIKSAAAYRLISLVGTLMLMLGVIALANARLELQFAWAGAYVIINAAHWIAAALAPRKHWDFSCYYIEEQGVAGQDDIPGFTEALWKAIMVAGATDWTRHGNVAVPHTATWDEWLAEASEQVKNVEEHKAALQDPYWPGKHPENTTIWCMPKEWDAKKAWEDINRKHHGGSNGQPAKTV